MLPTHRPLRLGRPSQGAGPSSVRVAQSAAPAWALAWVGVGLALVAGCSATEPSRRRGNFDEVQSLVRNERFEEALVLADALATRNPEDTVLRSVRRDAEVALMLDRARRLSFADEDEAALVQVEAAAELAPDLEQIAAWRGRIVEKLGERWFQKGRDAHAQGDYLQAQASYERALEYTPNHPLAAFQLEELGKYLGWRDAQSNEFYNGGVRAFAGALLGEARSSFESSRKYEDGDLARTERRISEVNRELALGRKHVAEGQAKTGYWRSAKRALDEALALDPQLAGGAELAAVYEREANVGDRLRDAEIARLRGEHERSRVLLAEARELTEFQGAAVEAALVAVDDSEAASLYQNALDLEYDFRFVEAVAKFRLLLEKRSFYKDARARVGTLEQSIKEAAELYEAAGRATSDSARADLYRRIELIWPEYRDVRTRLEALSAAN